MIRLLLRFLFAIPYPMFLGLLCAACSSVSPHPGTPLTVTNFQFGLACGPAYSPTSICTPTTDIDVTGKESCIYDRRPIDCTWYAYSFDYTSPQRGTVLDCDWSSNEASFFGNPLTAGKQLEATSHYRLPLPDSKGHIFHPQYAGVDPRGGIEDVKQSCSYDGKKLFEVEFRLHYGAPKDSKPV